MSTLYLTRGLPAAGKTTWAKAWVAEDPERRARVNRDDLRQMLYGAARLTFAQEAAVTEASRNAVRALLATGRDVVADDMNLRPKYVREWARFAAANGANVETVEFPVSVDESVERDANRERSVGEEAIRAMALRFTRKGQLQPVSDDAFDAEPGIEPYQSKPGTPAAIMVDIDGTLALMGDRSPYDLTRCSGDTPNHAVIEAVRVARAAGVRVIYCSGREDVARVDTEAWLAEHAGRHDDEPLFMRAAEDRRKDAVVKREIFDREIRDNYDVRYVLDDRQQVVDMWRSLGLTVFQVAPGDF